jgi:hypothetical protein
MGERLIVVRGGVKFGQQRITSATQKDRRRVKRVIGQRVYKIVELSLGHRRERSTAGCVIQDAGQRAGYLFAGAKAPTDRF